MSTSLLEAEQELSKQLGDYWSSTTTGAGTNSTLVDTALKAKENDWISGDCWAFLIEEPAGAAAIYDERKATSLDNDDGTLTTLAFAAAPGTGIDYEVHRLFSPSEKRRALVYAARAIYPSSFTEVRDESRVSGNWLKDGSFEIWTSSSALTYWTASTVTVTKTTSSPYYKHGATSCKLSGSAGYIVQSISNWDDLKRLAGKSVTFTVQGYSTTASSLRLAIYDGTTTTYSDYHDGDSTWTEDNDPLEVQADIQDNPTAIEFRIYFASGTAYVDDARVIGPDGARIYIGDLGLTGNKPHQVLREKSNYDEGEPWYLIHGITYDQTNGYMNLPDSVPSDYRLRILGTKYLNFYDSSGDVGTDWEDTIAIDSPQLDILVAEAAIYLYTQMVMPNYEAGESDQFARALSWWQNELRVRRAKYGMSPPDAITEWG
jgi:hypothetical protein